MTDPRVRPRMHPEATLDAAIALCLGAGAALAYSLTFHPDWIYDPLRYAQLMQGGPVRILLGPQHALGNAVRLAKFRTDAPVRYWSTKGRTGRSREPENAVSDMGLFCWGKKWSGSGCGTYG